MFYCRQVLKKNDWHATVYNYDNLYNQITVKRVREEWYTNRTKTQVHEKLSDENGIISALAFDQRGALKRLMAQHQKEPIVVKWRTESFVAEEFDSLRKHPDVGSPEYGLPATKALDKNAGLSYFLYERTGYATSSNFAC